MPDQPAQRPWRRRLLGAGVALATLVVLAATEPSLAIVWDEGYTLGREARVRAWFRALRDPAAFAASWRPARPDMVQDLMEPPRPGDIDTLPELFGPEPLAYFWPFGREEPHGHPPFYAIVGVLGDLLVPWREELARSRFGPMLAFSLVAGALAAFVDRRWGPWPAAAAVGAWVLQPRLFAHAHYAAYDALLTCLWVGGVLAFAKAVEVPEGETRPRSPRWGWVVLFGLLCGWAADTKLTGWFLPLPFLAWTALYRDRRGLLTLLAGGVIALFTLYAFNPPWWPDPIEGVRRFLDSNLSRDRTISIGVQFLGRFYRTPNQSLPWYNTLLLTVLVTPIGFLLLSLVGVGRALARWRSEPFGVLATGHWAFLVILRALPHAPGHDMERQFLPAFGLLAVVAGLGAATIVARSARLGKVLVAAALVEGAASLALMMPVPLSYFSPIVGGLPGASALGMEPTYYWDALDADTLAWLNEHTPEGAKVKFATEPTSWLYLQQTGRLRPGAYTFQPGVYSWYVVQNRPGSFSPLDRALVRAATPARVVTKWGVPLVWVFPIRDAIERSRALPRPGSF